MDLSQLTDEEILSLVSTDAADELKRRGYEFGWFKSREPVGAIYILINPAFPELVKIGYSDNVQNRMNSLNRSSGLPAPYHCYAVYRTRKKLGDKQLHALIDKLNPSLRYSSNREFYQMSGEEAFAILSAIAQINGDEEHLLLNPLEDSFFAPPAAQAPNSSEDQTSRQSPLTFGKIGIPVGSTLVFIKDHSITCTTVNTKSKVLFEGQTYALSALAVKLLNVSAAQGGKYFMYNGEVLTDIRSRLGV